MLQMFSSESSSYKTTTLQLSHAPSRRVRRVWHLQYSGWQDHGCPEDVAEYLSFCEEMGALRRHTQAEAATAGSLNTNTPVLVHCSAGVGRTGVTVLADILLYCTDHNIHIDIPKVLSHLRQQRGVERRGLCQLLLKSGCARTHLQRRHLLPRRLEGCIRWRPRRSRTESSPTFHGAQPRSELVLPLL